MDVPNRRLELRFRPDDGYSKPTCGDRHSTIGFLLRVRVKKGKREEMEDIVTKATTSKSTNDIRSQTAEFCVTPNENNPDSMSHSSGDKETNLSNVIVRKKNHKDDATSNFGNRVQQDINLTQCSSSQVADEKCANSDTENSYDTLIDTEQSSLRKEKNILLNFDSDKYINLSQDADYDLPCLKILGRVDTEFKFTSTLHFNYM